MVFFFTCSDPSYVVYMGKDKHENEVLLKYGFPEDIWFHVDSLSSAHVYLRLPLGSVELSGVKDKEEAKQRLLAALEQVPSSIVMEMAQLTKENSIEGCKRAAVDIVYTPFLNLRKEEERMETGQVGFKDEKFKFFLKNVERDKEALKRLNRTKEERMVDFEKERSDRETEDRARRRKLIEEQKLRQKEESRQHAEEKELKTYAALQVLDKTSNVGVSKTGTIEECKEIEEDFM